MDYVYICRPGDNEELRYSIRSVLKNTTCENIWVVGSKPSWYIGNFIEVPDKSSKFNNIRNCFREISRTEGISDDFVMMEDDMFIVKPIGDMPIFSSGKLIDRINYLAEMKPTATYVMLLRETYKYLSNHGIKDPINYEIHIPLVMNKYKLSKTINHLVFPKSVYGNLNNIGGTHIEDVKVHLRGEWVDKSYDFINGDLPFISTNEDDSFDLVYQKVLKDMFPEPSQYEY